MFIPDDKRYDKMIYNRLLAVPFLNYIIVYTKLKVNIPVY